MLNELKWRGGVLDDALIHYVHRGAPNDERIVEGSLVADLQRSFLVLRADGRETMIPYHRVFLIERGGEPIWQRRATDAS